MSAAGGVAAKGAFEGAAASVNLGITRFGSKNALNVVDVAKYENLTNSKFVGLGKSFTALQKAKILEQNIEANGGMLRSDLDGTILVRPLKSSRGVTPPTNEAQVDHILPKTPNSPRAPPGSNSYDNAQVLSREQNRVKSNN